MGISSRLPSQLRAHVENWLHRDSTARPTALEIATVIYNFTHRQVGKAKDTINNEK